MLSEGRLQDEVLKNGRQAFGGHHPSFSLAVSGRFTCSLGAHVCVSHLLYDTLLVLQASSVAVVSDGEKGSIQRCVPGLPENPKDCAA